ncbi:hypothetical protein ABET51_14005 [Metabacillus fastidiosus]|nr:hypothetical protein [Metabacillus fastidiosus]
MNSNKNKQNNEEKQGLQSKDDNLETKNNVSAQEDGFRYDYDDSK